MSRPAPRVLSVGELAGALAGLLENEVGWVWVAGELSGLRIPSSGHLYFTLKDEDAQLRAAMFRSAARLLPFRPADGMQVIVGARVGLYPARGDLQLYVERMEPRGLGALRLAFEQLKERLQIEGLFAAERKRPLPRFPRTIGIVTALSGAAVHDMRVVLRRRWPAARVVVRPVRVQGLGAAEEIALGIADLEVLGVDVCIVGRGGGSLEDLWAFNEEVVARAIAVARMPIVSAVGHEVDVTIADFVADVRAATPTAAAALVVPDRVEIARTVGLAQAALCAALTRRVRGARERVDGLQRRLGSPRRRLEVTWQRVDELRDRLPLALRRRAVWERRELGGLATRLAQAGPAARVAAARRQVEALDARLRTALGVRLREARAQVAAHGGRLEALSPLACLARGYAIVRRGAADGPVVQDAAALTPGDAVTLVLARGRAGARITDTES